MSNIGIVSLVTTTGVNFDINVYSIRLMYHLKDCYSVIYGSGDNDYVQIDEKQYKSLMNGIDYFREASHD
jgi:hypothetical protein